MWNKCRSASLVIGSFSLPSDMLSSCVWSCLLGLFLTTASLVQVIRALKWSHTRLFCLDTGSIPGRSTFFFPANFFFAKNIYLKKTVLSKLLKVNVKVRNASQYISKVFSPQKMALEKLSVFAYVISWKQSANQQNQLRNDAFYIKTSHSAKDSAWSCKNKNRP